MNDRDNPRGGLFFSSHFHLSIVLTLMLKIVFRDHLSFMKNTPCYHISDSFAC